MKRLLPILAVLALVPGLAFAGHGDVGDPGVNITPFSSAPVETPVLEEADAVEADAADPRAELARMIRELVRELLLTAKGLK